MKLLAFNMLAAWALPMAYSFAVAPQQHRGMSSALASTAASKGTDICPFMPSPEDPSKVLEIAAG